MVLIGECMWLAGAVGWAGPALLIQRAVDSETAAAAMALSLTQEYFQIPVVTRAYTTACVLTTAAVVRSKLPTQSDRADGALNYSNNL